MGHYIKQELSITTSNNTKVFTNLTLCFFGVSGWQDVSIISLKWDLLNVVLTEMVSLFFIKPGNIL